MNDHPNALPAFLLTFFLGFIGSFVVNVADLAPKGYKSRTLAYFFLDIITFRIYGLVASICNFAFSSEKQRNIGYKRI